LIRKNKGEIITKADRRATTRQKRRDFQQDNRRSVRLIAKQSTKPKR